MTTIRVQGKPLYQWDTDRRVIIEPGNGVTIDDVHFSVDGENSLGVEHAADENGIVSAPIPNILLQSGSNITVYACMATANGQHTIASRIVSVINRAKPADYVYTETEVKSYAALKKKLSEKLPANQGAENAGKVLVIDDDGYAVPGEVQGSGETGAGIDLTGATAGQVAQIAEVDENGAPTKWHPADLPKVEIPPLIVSMTPKNGQWVADHTRSEIVAHVEKGGSVGLAAINNLNAYYWSHNDQYAIFRDVRTATARAYTIYYYIDESGVCTDKTQDYTPPAMRGATADADGASGVVPVPAAGDDGKFLRGDGTWGEIDVPTDAHINELINTALGVIENGAY